MKILAMAMARRKKGGHRGANQATDVLEGVETVAQRDGRQRNGDGQPDDDGGVAEGKKESDAHGLFSFLHQLAGDIVDGGDVIGIDRMAQAEEIGGRGDQQQRRKVVESDQRPGPRQNVAPDQAGVHPSYPPAHFHRYAGKVGNDAIHGDVSAKGEPPHSYHFSCQQLKGEDVLPGGVPRPLHRERSGRSHPELGPVNGDRPRPPDHPRMAFLSQTITPQNWSCAKGICPPLAFDDPTTLRQNLRELATSAFEVTLDGRTDPLQTISELTLAPDGGCFATLIYTGQKKGRVTVRETILPAYPASYIINYEIYNPLDRGRGVSGYLTGGAPGPAVAYTQLASDAAPSISDALNSAPVRLFKSDLRTPWIDTNWLFTVILLSLLRPARELYPLFLIMAMAAVVPRFLWVMDNLQIPFSIHAILPGIVTALLCGLCLRRPPSLTGLGAALTVSSLLDGCYDIQQTPLERPEAAVTNLLGLCLGFVSGLALIFAVGYPLVSECRKYPGFQRGWAPKIGWALAAAALILPWVKS